ncbi:MAG TPA: hypothetical protein VMQ99_25635 [Acetobacteraceae bacterium]|jgi:hypothetical protein|nr:hypothetical protein [Acetobacteraceae bacterium]
MVAERGASVLLQVHRGLQSLLRCVPGADAVLESDEAVPPFDLQCSLMSLPLAFRTELASIVASVPHLFAEPQRVAAWHERLGPRRGMRIGIVWSGNPSHANDHNRSIPLELLSGILSRHDIDFHMLQIVAREADRAALEGLPQLRNHIAALAEMADTAALMSLLDLVITVDTAAAHLGGALGLPAWVMLPWAADWRWMLDRTDTPWYPTIRLFRQARRGDWGGVLADVAQALDRWSL